jgi:methionine-gamma-lyase
MKKRIQSLRDVQHFGEEGGVVPVIDVAATSTFLNPVDMERTFNGELEGCYLYSRHSNPSVTAFGKKFAALEGTEAALGVASGMAAIASTIDQLVGNGGHIVTSRTVYGGTYALFKNILPRRGIEVSFVDADDLKAVEAAIRPSTRVIFTESLSNPLLRISNLKALAGLSKKHGLKLVVDNTFVPLIVNPADHGADVVIHSCTKYISGASDMIAGVIAGKQDFISSLIDVNHGSVMLNGPVMDARIAHELYLRLDHLDIRVRAHSEMASFLAHKMEESGIPVIYPGLSSHPQFDLMKQHMNSGYGFGGMLTVDCGTSQKAMELAQVLQNVKFGLYAVSLGFSRTLMSCPSVSTSSEIPQKEQQEMNLSPGLLRLSIGFTGDRDVMWDRFISSYQKVFPSK